MAQILFILGEESTMSVKVLRQMEFTRMDRRGFAGRTLFHSSGAEPRRERPGQ